MLQNLIQVLDHWIESHIFFSFKRKTLLFALLIQSLICINFLAYPIILGTYNELDGFLRVDSFDLWALPEEVVVVEALPHFVLCRHFKLFILIKISRVMRIIQMLIYHASQP